MSTIPLPALHLQTDQQQPGPLDAYAKLLQLRNLQAQGQTQQLSQQAMQQENQQRAIALQDQQASTAALKEWDGKDVNDLPGLLLKNGASSTAVFGMKNAIVTQRKAAADVDEATLKNVATRNDMIAGHLDNVRDAKPEDKQQAFDSALTDLEQKGFLKPGQIPHQYPGDDQLDIIEKQFLGHKQIIDQAMKDREVSATEQKNQIEAQKFAATQSGGTQENPEQRYIRLKAKQDQGQSLTPEEQAQLKATSQYKTMVPAFNFNLQAQGVGGGPGNGAAAAPQGSYDDQIKALGAKGGVVKAIIEGRQDPPASFAQKSPYWQDVMQKVYAIDPEFNVQRAQLRKAYTTGSQSKEINAINTAMGHVGVLGQAIDALDNGNVRVLNAIGNRLGVETGNDAQTTFNTIVHRVGPELSKAYIGAGGSAGERGADEKDFDPNLGPKQLESNVAITAQLLRSKISALENQWDQNKAPGMKSFQDQFITPEAKGQLDKWNPPKAGLQVGQSVTLKNGKTVKVTAVHPDGSFDAQ